MTIAAAYAGTAPVVHGFYFANLVNSSANPVLTFVEFDGASLANNNNATAGTTNNSTFRANGWTAASGAGGTINNYDFNAVTPTAGGAGTTNNYGLYVQGNGATACTGTCTNYAGYFTLSAGNNTAISNYGIYINGNGGASAANNYALFSASTAPMKISGLFLNAVYAIASLPSCSATLQGATAIVNNGQASPTYLGTVSTTGTVIARVMCNGTAWVYAANDNVPWRKVA
jgi:hypothetical protein